MKTRRLLLILMLPVLAAWVVSCDSPDAPVPNLGQVVLRFEPGGGGSPSLIAGARSAAQFDSVVVNVFRSGNGARLEVSHGAALSNGDAIEIKVGCIAENGKKVGVDLYAAGVLAYHGYNADVNVSADHTTAVTIDASPFIVSSLALTPQIIPDGAAFTLHWPVAPAASFYRLEQSATLDFATLVSSQSIPDTTVDVHVPTGTHYFRVRPMTPYATGVATLPRFGYVTGGSATLQISAVSAAVIPGETISIQGENLDFPGTQVMMNGRALAITDIVSVSSSLGDATSPNDVSVQRVAYVNATGEFADSYAGVLARYADDFGKSGVASIPVAQLDTRDMSVFDIILVANDTGDAPLRWGGKASRYTAITTSGAGVIAIGEGGANFLKLAFSSIAGVNIVSSSQTSYYTNSPASTIFTTPHTVTNGTLPQWIDVCPQPETTVALSMGTTKPADATLYAQTSAAISNPKWVVGEFLLGSIRYIYLGYGDDPANLSVPGQDVLGNAMYLLYKDRPVTPAQAATRAR